VPDNGKPFNWGEHWPSYAIACSTFVLGCVLGVIFEEWFGKWVINDLQGALFFVAVLLIIIVILLKDAVHLMRRLDRRVGIKFRYIENDGSGRVYIKCRNVVRRATKNILILNSYMAEGHGDDQRKERSDYYDSLLERARNGVEYIRIIQVRRDESNLLDLSHDEIHSGHLRKMIDLRRGPCSSTIMLKKCPARRLSTFILIDGEHLIWQINAVDFAGGNETLQLQGVFIIHDPQHKITELFEKHFFSIFRGDATELKWDGVAFR
jgi:hypothetical protein